MSLDNQNNDQPPKKPLEGPPRGNRFALILFIALMGAFSVFFLTDQKSATNEISYSAFLSYLEQGNVEAVKIVDQTEIEGKLRGKTGNTALFKTRIPYTDLDLLKMLRESGVSIEGGVRGVSVLQVMLETLPWIFGFFIIWMMLRQFQGNNKAFSFGKSRAKHYLDVSKKTTFDDVAGQKEAKYELTRSWTTSRTPRSS